MSAMMTHKACRAYARDLRDKQNRVAAEFREKLIKAVHERTPIWDRRDKDYRDRSLKDLHWCHIANIMNCPKEKVKSIWKTLKDGFRVRCTAVQRACNGESVEEAAASVSWPYFASLLFLRDVMYGGESCASIASDDVQESQIASWCEGDTGSDNNIEAEPVEEFGNGKPTLTPRDTDICDSEEFSASGDHLYSINMSPQSTDKSVDSPCASSQKSYSFSSHNKFKTDHESTERYKYKRRIKSPAEEYLSTPLQDTDMYMNSTSECSSKFATYLLDVLQDVPIAKRRHCEMQLLQIVHAYVLGRNPVIITDTTVDTK